MLGIMMKYFELRKGRSKNYNKRHKENLDLKNRLKFKGHGKIFYTDAKKL